MSISLFIQNLKKTRRDLIKCKIQVSDVVEMRPQFHEYAACVIKQESNGKGFGPEYVNSLEDYLMLCLDVYTYSDNGDTMIPDYTYDMVMNIAKDLFHIDGYCYADYVESKTIWSFRKHEAPFMVGTISRKIYTVADVKVFLKERKENGYKKILYAPKFDGISSVVTYRNGIIERAMTRNNGVDGMDITETIRRTNQAKKIFTREMPDGYYKCEITMSTADFLELTEIKEYSNRRSAASAVVSTPSNLPYANFLTIIPLAWVNWEGTHFKYLAEVYARGYYDNPESFDLEDVMNNIERILAHIRSREYPMRVDGVVLFPVRTDDEEPNTTDLMANCMAYKVNTQEAMTRIKYAYMSIGRLGQATPMLKVDPVEVNETIVQDVSAGSMTIFSSRCYHENEEVIIFSAGDVMPQAKLPEERNYPKGAKRLQIDLTCPYCGKRLKTRQENAASIYCVNPNCPRVLSGRISNFLDKMEVAEGFRDSTFYTLCEKKVVRSIEDLFTLKDHIDEVYAAGIGKLTADQLIVGLKELRTKQFEVSTVIGSLGIENIGRSTCKAIFRDSNLGYLMTLKPQKVFMSLLNIPRVGKITAQCFAEWLDDNHDFVNFLLKEMNIVDDKLAYGNVCFTGFRNKDYDAEFKKIGFPVIDGLNKDTVAVVFAGDIKTGKAAKALDRNIPLVHVVDIDKLFNLLTKESEEIQRQETEYKKSELTRYIFRALPCQERP